MGKSSDVVSYPSPTKMDAENKSFNSKSILSNNHVTDVWATTEDSGLYSFQKGLSQIQENSIAIPEVNLENVLKGVVAIITGKNKSNAQSRAQSSNSNLSFLESSKNGDSFLHSSVYAPSAPSLHVAEALKLSHYKEILLSEPPEWLPDSSSSACMQCNLPFKAFTRSRHHCRFCGGIFCWACSKGRCLMPVKFRQREPQRVCDSCYDRLEPLQDVLIKSMSNAMQVAKHDVTDWTCSRGWLNLPIGLSMEHEIYKAINTLRSYCQVHFFYRHSHAVCMKYVHIVKLLIMVLGSREQWKVEKVGESFPTDIPDRENYLDHIMINIPWSLSMGTHVSLLLIRSSPEEQYFQLCVCEQTQN